MKKIPSVQPIRAPLESQEKSIFERKDIPLINFVNIDELDGLHDKLRNMKINNYQNEFINEMNKILILYDDNELKYNAKFVLFIMEQVERYLLKPKCGQSKKQLVIEVCKKYFNNDPDLVDVIINLMFDQLKQVKFLKRQALKIIRFFLKVRQNQH